MELTQKRAACQVLDTPESEYPRLYDPRFGKLWPTEELQYPMIAEKQLNCLEDAKSILFIYNESKIHGETLCQKYDFMVNQDFPDMVEQLDWWREAKKVLKTKLGDYYPIGIIECHVILEWMSKKIHDLEWILEFQKSGLKWDLSKPIPLQFQTHY